MVQFYSDHDKNSKTGRTFKWEGIVDFNIHLIFIETLNYKYARLAIY